MPQIVQRSAALGLLSLVLVSHPARADDATRELLDEVRHSFTLDGKPIPPEIFRDIGDGNLADSLPIRVTIDVTAAVGSNLYGDEITPAGPGWRAQRPADKASLNGTDEYAYHYVGATANGLLVVLASANKGGSCTFVTLHILDLAGAKAFTPEGQVYERINVTALRDISLGDRWYGTARIAGNTIIVTTTRSGPTDDSGKAPVMKVEAGRPQG